MIRISDKSMFAYFNLYIANKLPQTDLTKRERRLVRELARNEAWRKLLLKQPLRRAPPKWQSPGRTTLATRSTQQLGCLQGSYLRKKMTCQERGMTFFRWTGSKRRL